MVTQALDDEEIYRRMMEHNASITFTSEETRRIQALQGPPIFVPSFAGKEIGRGSRRVVFEHKKPEYVVKAVRQSARYDNMAEWVNYKWLCDHGAAQYVAPCVSVDREGLWLIQVRTQPLPPRANGALPYSLLADPNPANYGLLGGRLVCHDYAIIRRDESMLSHLLQVGF